MEREEAERRRYDEEERRRRTYQDQIVQSAHSGQSLIDTSSAMSGGPFVDPAAKRAEPSRPVDDVVPGKAIFEDKDKEEDLRKEEEYLLRRTGSVVTKKKAAPTHVSSLSGDHMKDAHLSLSPKQQRIVIAWVDSGTGDTIQALPFFANAGRLPMMAVEGAFKVKNVVWKETQQALTAGPDGFSTVSVGTRGAIEIIADRN